METKFAGSELERYPAIPFLLMGLPPDAFFVDEAMLSLDQLPFRVPLDLEEVELLYVFGLGLGAPYQALRGWLHARPERKLIFLEDRKGALAAFLQTPCANECLLDPQVVFEWIEDLKNREALLEEWVSRYPSIHVELIGCTSYARRRASLVRCWRLQLMRKTAVVDAQMKEAMYVHQLIENILPNIRQWPQSFFANAFRSQFKNVPAIICGAGPSLNESIEMLRQVEDRALIIAGGSTITALSQQGIVPHFGIVLDPNPEEYSRLRAMSAFEMPLLYGTRVRKEVFRTGNGPLGYLRTGTGGPSELYFEERFGIEGEPIGPDMGPEAFSVTTLAITFAVAMGCNPILLNGIDLAYTGGRRYAEGVLPASDVQIKLLRKEKKAADRLLRRKGKQGKSLHTLVKWVMEADAIAAYAEAHPEVQWWDVSAQGLGFKGIAQSSLSALKATHLSRQYDLRAKVHQLSQAHRFSSPTQAHIQEQLETLYGSVRQLLKNAEALVEELKRVQSLPYSPDLVFPTGKMTLFQMEFEEEEGFVCFFAQVGPALDRWTHHLYPERGELSEADKHGLTVQRLIYKWEYIAAQCRSMLSSLQAEQDPPYAQVFS